MLLRRKVCQGSVRKLLVVMLAFVLCLPLMWVPAPAEASAPDGVYAFGSHGRGQLGHGDRIDPIGFYRNPNRIEGLGNVKDVAAGDHHSLVLLHNGDVYSFGEDYGHGKLGQGEMEDRYMKTPTRIEGIGRAKAIGAGRNNSFIILENGDLYSFGRNSLGALGVGDYDNRLVPTRVEGISNAVKVDAGEAHTLILLENGDVYGMGCHMNGKLGIGGPMSLVGQHHETPVKVPLSSPAKDIAAGSIHSLVLLENGDVYSFGNGLRGQLGHPERKNVDSPTKIEGLGPARAVAAGSDYSMVLLENGDLYAFGYNSYGQLGLGDRENRNQPTKVEALSGVSMIACGYRHTLVVLENGDLYTFGQGASGKLGHGNEQTQTTPTLVETLVGNNVLTAAGGFHHSLVLVGTPPITIEIDGQLLRTDVPPIILEGRTMVPLRAIFEALDITVEYDAATRTIIGTTDDLSIQLTIDSTLATVNGEEVTLDVPATVIDGRTMVPVRFIAESTGATVEWEARTRTVIINTVSPDS